jgi:N-methylhydantoinase B/oxoprolinase/acetone carboxylase alpha subunit
MLCLNAEIICSQMTDRHFLAPWGLEGGKEGGLGATLVLKADSDKWQTMREAYGKASTSRYSNVSIRRGDRVRLVTPGGGGYGDPAQRDQAAIERDLREGYISKEAAGKFYGYKES